MKMKLMRKRRWTKKEEQGENVFIGLLVFASRILLFTRT